MQKVAVLGLGKMGKGIALSLIRTGHTVRVWNRTISKSQDLLAAGALIAPNPAAAVLDAEVVIAMLSDDEASQQVWFGKDGALDALRPGSFVIECSTLSLEHVNRLSTEAIKRGLRYLDCPVTGIPQAAQEGKLTLLLGASDTNKKACEKMLLSFSRQIHHFGPVGTGTSYKLMINLMGAVQIAALAEGISMAKKLGLDEEKLVEAIESSAAASPQVLRYVRRMTAGNFVADPPFTVSLRYKDARYALALARQIEAPARLGYLAAEWFGMAMKEHASDDEAFVIEKMLN